MGLKQRITLVMVLILGVILLGSTGYWLFFRHEASFLDCVYMTVISLTTVGYGEVIDVSGNMGAKIFTMGLIVFGMGIILYGISMLTATFIEGEISGLLRKKRMLRKIASLSDHFIVCGGGETGRPVVRELLKNARQVVLIEQDPTHIDRCLEQMPQLLFITGDASDDGNLEAAGIGRAAGIIICLPSDKDNLYITMTARMLNPRIRIIVRMTEPKLEPKLYKAGANSVVSPNRIGALRLASEMIRPTVVDFLDSMLRSSQGDLRINQLRIPEGSGPAWGKISDLGLKERFNLLLLGTKPPGADIAFDPPLDSPIDPGTDLIVMGRVSDVEKAAGWIRKHG